MSANFSIKENKVYFKGNLLKNISSEKFETITYTNEFKQTYVKCLKDKKGIWFFHQRGKGITRFLTADTDNFSFINEDYARDSKSVFLVSKDGFLIPESDANSFTVLTNTPYFAKDKNQVYALDAISGLSIYRYANCDSIVSANGNQNITDKHNLYQYSSDITLANDQKYISYFDASSSFEEGKGQSVFEANKAFLSKYYPNTIGWWHKDYPFQIEIGNNTQLGFYKTKEAVFYLESNFHLKHSVPTLIFNADVASFKALNEYYGADNKSVYFKSTLIQGVDLETFNVIDGKLAQYKNNYLYNGNRLECDFNSFDQIDKSQIFFKDKNTLFSEKPTREGKTGVRYEIVNSLSPIKNSSPNTLKIFSKAWAKDEFQVYVYAQPYSKADAQSFQQLFEEGPNDWAKDKNHLFNSNGKRIIKGIDGSTFKVLNKYWGKDLAHVFCFPSQRIVSTIDSETFKVTDDKGGAEDKKHVFSFDNYNSLKKKKLNKSGVTPPG